MNKRAPLFALLVLLIVLSMALVGCNRERPAPTSTSATPALTSGTVTPAPPGAAVTRVTLPSQTAQSAGAATPVPLTPVAAVTSAPPEAASTAPEAASPAARAVEETTYVVQRGDTLAKIATRYGVTVKQLTDLNALKNPNVIIPGQKLRIPGTGTTAAVTSAPSGSPKTYTVQAGDTLADIATKFGVTVQALQQTNNLSNPDQIYSGQILKIP